MLGKRLNRIFHILGSIGISVYPTCGTGLSCNGRMQSLHCLTVNKVMLPVGLHIHSFNANPVLFSLNRSTIIGRLGISEAVSYFAVFITETVIFSEPLSRGMLVSFRRVKNLVEPWNLQVG